MKTLNDFKKENKDLEKLEMTNALGGLANPKVTRTITAEADSNWNCGDVKTCTTTYLGDGHSVTVCDTESLTDNGL